MTPEDIIIRALNYIKNSNLKKGKGVIKVSGVKRADDGIRFIITQAEDTADNKIKQTVSKCLIPYAIVLESKEEILTFEEFVGK